MQADILAKLTEAAILTVVGDEKQSIFGFRGAEATIFRSVRSRISDDGGSGVVLSTSFRTHTELLGPINGCFAPIFGAVHEALTPHRMTPPHEGPHLEAFAITLREGEKAARRLCLVHEARELATRIKALIDDETPIYDPRLQASRPLGPGDVAVLTRTWRTLDVFNEIFPAVGLPVVHTGGGNLLDTREAKDGLVLLQVLAEPEDDLSLVALLRGPYFAVSDPALYQLRQQKDEGERWWDVLGRSEDEAARRAETILRELHDASQHHRATRLLQLADRATGYTAVIGNLPGAERRLADYRGFVTLVRKLEGGLGDVFSVSRRLRRLHLAEAKVQRPKLQGLGAVSLMTLHAAKGSSGRWWWWPTLITTTRVGKRLRWWTASLAWPLNWATRRGFFKPPRCTSCSSREKAARGGRVIAADVRRADPLAGPPITLHFGHQGTCLQAARPRHRSDRRLIRRGHV